MPISRPSQYSSQRAIRQPAASVESTTSRAQQAVGIKVGIRCFLSGIAITLGLCSGSAATASGTNACNLESTQESEARGYPFDVVRLRFALGRKPNAPSPVEILIADN